MKNVFNEYIATKINNIFFDKLTYKWWTIELKQSSMIMYKWLGIMTLSIDDNDDLKENQQLWQIQEFISLEYEM